MIFFKKMLSVFLIVSLSMAASFSNFGIFPKPPSIASVFADEAQTKRQKMLDDFYQLKTKIEGLSEVLLPAPPGEVSLDNSSTESPEAMTTSAQWHRDSIDTDSIEEMKNLKNMTEGILNAPSLNWDEGNDEFYVSEFQKVLSLDFPDDLPPLQRNQKVFSDTEMHSVENFSLLEKEKIFLAYIETLETVKKILYLKYEKGGNKNTQELTASIRRFNLRLNEDGKKDFKKFVSQVEYGVIEHPSSPRYEVVAHLRKNIASEFEILSSIQDEYHWKHLLKRKAIDLLVKNWVALDSVWLPERFPKAQQHSVLPISCADQYPSLVPLTVPILLREEEGIPDRAIFETQLYTGLQEDQNIELPALITEAVIAQLVNAVSFWREERDALPSEEDRKEMMTDVTVALSEMENKLSRYVLSWFLKAQNKDPFFWEGSEENIKEKIRKALVRSKKILFLSIIERVLANSRQSIDEETKLQILAVAEKASEIYGAAIDMESLTDKTPVDQIYEIYSQAKNAVHEIHQMMEELRDPHERVKEMMKSALETSEQLAAQDQKILRLDSENLPPIEDTPENFKIVSLVFAKDILDSIQSASFEEIRNILDGTYDTAKQRYREWVSSRASQVSERVLEDVEKISRYFRLHENHVLNDLLADREKRKEFEEMVKLQQLGTFSFLKNEVTHEQQSRPLYQQLLLARERNESQEVMIDLFQRALWHMKELVKHEMDRFCRADPQTDEGLKLLLSHTLLRELGLSQHPEFEKVNERVMHEIDENLSTFESAIGYGFLSIILLSFVSGPMSRLPRWLGGRWVPKIPNSLLQLSHQFGMLAAPFAFYWMFRDFNRYFLEEEAFIESLENWDESRFEMFPMAYTPTLVDLLEAVENKKDGGGGRRHPDLFENRVELRVAQGAFLLFAPIQIAFIRGFMESMYCGYAYRLRPFRVGVPAALRDLKIPTRFWTFKAGQELLSLSREELRGALTRGMDRAISIPRFKQYVEKWIKILRADLLAHEAQWGIGINWRATKNIIQSRSQRVLLPRHVDAPRYFVTDRSRLFGYLIEERMRLMTTLRLYENAFLTLEQTAASKISEVSFHQGFSPAISELKAFFSDDALKGLESLEIPEHALAWVLTRINVQRFLTLWFGAWVGYNGPLGRAIKQTFAYNFLFSTRDPFSLRYGGIFQQMVVRKAIERVIQRRREAGLSTQRREDISQEEIERTISEILRSEG